MKAFVIDHYKPADGGRLTERADPEPGAGQVLVEVHAAGVNPLDVRIRSGEFRLILRHRMPLVLGNDVAGVVTAVGSDVQRFRVGDEVYARTKDAVGAFAELVALDDADVAFDVGGRLDPARRVDGVASPRRAGEAAGRRARLRLDLEPRGIQVIGVHCGFVDTDLTSGLEAPKITPADVAQATIEGIIAGHREVIVDDESRRARSHLTEDLAVQYPQLAATT